MIVPIYHLMRQVNPIGRLWAVAQYVLLSHLWTNQLRLAWQKKRGVLHIYFSTNKSNPCTFHFLFLFCGNVGCMLHSSRQDEHTTSISATLLCYSKSPDGNFIGAVPFILYVY